MAQKDTARAIRLLAGMHRDNYQALLAQSAYQEIPSRTVLFREGSALTHLHVVLSGSVELFSSAGSKQATISIITPGEAFILAAVVRNVVALMTAKTIKRTKLLMIPAEAFREAMRKDIGLTMAVAETVSTDFRKLVWQLRGQKLCSGQERLVEYLMEEVRQEGCHQGVTLKIPKRALASLLGLEPESLSRLFKMLRQHGVTGAGREIGISDVKLLRGLLKQAQGEVRTKSVVD